MLVCPFSANNLVSSYPLPYASLNSSLYPWLLGKISGRTRLGSWLQIAIRSFYTPFPTLQDFPFCLLSGGRPPLCDKDVLTHPSGSAIRVGGTTSCWEWRTKSSGTWVLPLRLSSPSPLLRFLGILSSPLPRQGVSDLRYHCHQIGKPCLCRVGGFPGYSLASVWQQTWGNGGEWAGHVVKPATGLEVLSTLLISCPGYYISYGSYYARKRNYQVQEYWTRLQKDTVCWGDWSQRTPK